MSNRHLKYIILAGLFLAPFVPLIVAKSLFFPFITGKAFFFRLIVEIIFATWLILAMRDESYRPKWSWIMGAVLIFLVSLGLSTIFSENPFKSFWSNYERMEGFIALLHLGMFFVVAGSVLKTQEIWNKLLATSVGASAIMALYSFFQLAGKITINQGGVRVDGTFGNASYLGIYMVFHIFFALLLLMRFRRHWQKWLLGAVVLMDLIVLYYTATRGAILGLLGGLFVSFLMIAWKSEKGGLVRKTALGVIIGLFVLVGGFVLFRNNEAVRNSPILGRFASLSFSEIKTQGRYFVWPMAWKGFLERPIFGWGQESFNFVFNKHYDPRMYRQEPWFDRTHNVVLDWLIAGGALGFISYISIFVALGYYLWKAKEDFLSRNDKALILGLVLAYIFHNLFVFDQIGSYILFFTILAYVHAHTPESHQSLWQKISDKCKVFLTSSKNQPIAESVVLIMLFLTLYFVVYAPWRQNLSLLNALRFGAEGKVGELKDYTRSLAPNKMGFSEAVEHVSQTAVTLSLNQSAPQELKRDLNQKVKEAFIKQLERTPNDARYRLFFGLFLGRAGDLDGALKELEKALELSPRKQSIYFEIANVLFSQGKTKEALERARQAYELEPSYEEAALIYGIIALSSGEATTASQILSKIPEDKLIFDDRFISILAQIGDFEKVIEVAERRVAADPRNAQHKITLAAAYLQAGRRNEAIKAIEEIIAMDPSFKERGEYYINEIKAGRNP